MQTCPENRRAHRFAVEVSVVLNHLGSARRIRAELLDISQSGCRVSTEEPIAADTPLFVKIQGLETWRAKVIWREGKTIGVEFERPMHVAVVEHYAGLFDKAGLRNPT